MEALTKHAQSTHTALTKHSQSTHTVHSQSTHKAFTKHSQSTHTRPLGTHIRHSQSTHTALTQHSHNIHRSLITHCSHDSMARSAANFFSSPSREAQRNFLAALPRARTRRRREEHTNSRPRSLSQALPFNAHITPLLQSISRLGPLRSRPPNFQHIHRNPTNMHP